MTDAEKIRRDMETLIQALRLDVVDSRWRSAEHRSALQSHLEWCIGELSSLLGQLKRADAGEGLAERNVPPT